MALTIAEDMSFADIKEKLNEINNVLEELKVLEKDLSVRSIVYKHLQDKNIEICNKLQDLNESVMHTNNKTEWTREKADEFIEKIINDKCEHLFDDELEECYYINGMRKVFIELFNIDFNNND